MNVSGFAADVTYENDLVYRGQQPGLGQQPSRVIVALVLAQEFALTESTGDPPLKANTVPELRAFATDLTGEPRGATEFGAVQEENEIFDPESPVEVYPQK